MTCTHTRAHESYETCDMKIMHLKFPRFSTESLRKEKNLQPPLEIFFASFSSFYCCIYDSKTFDAKFNRIVDTRSTCDYLNNTRELFNASNHFDNLSSSQCSKIKTGIIDFHSTQHIVFHFSHCLSILLSSEQQFVLHITFRKLSNFYVKSIQSLKYCSARTGKDRRIHFYNRLEINRFVEFSHFTPGVNHFLHGRNSRRL